MARQFVLAIDLDHPAFQTSIEGKIASVLMNAADMVKEGFTSDRIFPKDGRCAGFWVIGEPMLEEQNFEGGITVCIWHQAGAWWWDDEEDHGGYDRVSPQGPHDSPEAALADAKARFPHEHVASIGSKPFHYPI